MDIANVWNIVWQDTYFHKAIAIVIFFAIIYENYTLIEYFYLKCGATANGIKYLNKPPQNKKNKPSKQVYSWLTKHFETDNNHGYLKIESKFILKKYPIVLSRPVPRSSLRFVTTLCTSIGVLGTFYGIQQGLQGLNLDIANSQQLMASSIELLKSMKTAFSTSLMGLGCGSLFTLVLFVTDSLRQNRRNGLRDQLDNLTTFETAENDNQKLVEEIGKLRQSLTNQQSPTAEAIGEAVGRSIAEQFTALNQLTSEAIGKAVAQQMYSQLKPIYKEQQILRRQLEENQGHKVIEKLIQDLIVQVIEPVTQRLDESAKLTKQASQAVEKLNDELGGISQSLASSIQTIQQFQQQTLVDLQNFANNLGQTLNQFQINTTTTFQQQTDTLSAVGNQASGLMNSAKDSLLATLENIDKTLTTTRQTVQDDLTRFREEYQNNLNNFFKTQNNLLEESLGKQRNGLAEVVTNLNTVFEDEYNRRRELAEETNQIMTTLRNAMNETGNLANAIGLNSSQRLIQLQELAREIGIQTQSVQREYRQLSNTFSQSLTDWTNHFSNSRQTFFNEADSAMASVCSNLLQTAEVLVAANDNRNNGNGRNHHA